MRRPRDPDAARRALDQVWRYLRVLGADADEAEELAQDAFVALLQVEREHPRETPLGWLRATARRMWWARCRADDRRRRALQMVGDAIETAWAEYEGDDDGDGYRDALGLCLSALSADDRVAIEACYRDGRPRAEVAAALGLGPEALKSRLRRCKQRLRKCIERRLSR